MVELNVKETAQSITERTKRQLISIAILLFITCLALIITFVIYMVNATTESYMRLEANYVITRLESNSNIELPQRKELSVYRSWEQIPSVTRELFDKNTLEPMSPVTIDHISDNGQRNYVYIFYAETEQVGDVYFIGIEDADNVDKFLTPLFTSAFIKSLLFTVVVFCVLFLLIAWIFKRSMEPLIALVDWSKNMQKNPSNKISAEFSVRELNQIAGYLTANIEQIKAFNERESQFLKHTSHELRTPLATMQASLDTINLRMLKTDVNQPPLTRALRASNNMINLSDTLLWLARESNKTIPKKHISITECCRKIITEHSYLINDESITVELSNTDYVINIEDELLRIVLSNVIRNAYQYTFSGRIGIETHEDYITVSNTVDTEEETDTQSFGLGLQLVEKIAQKINWSFDFTIKNNTAIAVINWHNEKEV